MNYEKTAKLVLRLGLAATYLYSGIDLIMHPTAWIAFIPSWLTNLLSVSVLTYIKFQGGVELLLAVGFLLGIGLRLVSLVSALEMLAILLFYGFDGITFRDLAILGAALSVFFTTFKKPQSLYGSS